MNIGRASLFLLLIVATSGCAASFQTCTNHMTCGKKFEPVRFRRVEPEQFGNKFFVPTQGKITVVDFWATWCEPCMKNMERLNELAIKWRKDGVVTFGVNGHESVKKIKNTLKKDLRMSGLSFPMAADTETKLGSFLESEKPREGLPVMLVFDAEGVLRLRVTSDDGDYLSKVDNAVNALLRGK